MKASVRETIFELLNEGMYDFNKYPREDALLQGWTVGNVALGWSVMQKEEELMLELVGSGRSELDVTNVLALCEAESTHTLTPSPMFLTVANGIAI